MRQANGRFRDARTSQSPERAAKLREEGEERLEELAKIDPEAWPWRPWMYAVRDTEFIVPEDGSAFVYEGLRVARPRPGAAGQFDHLEFGRVLTTPNGERIGLRAAASPTWELVTGLTLTPEHLPREGGPAWPDDEASTAARASTARSPIPFAMAAGTSRPSAGSAQRTPGSIATGRACALRSPPASRNPRARASCRSSPPGSWRS
jgi:hypothetical protein